MRGAPRLTVVPGGPRRLETSGAGRDHVRVTDASIPRPAARRPPRGRVLAVAAAALVAGGTALGIASLMDEPVDGAARDLAPIVVGNVVPPGEELTGENTSGLPPLAIVLAAATPQAIAALPAAQQVVQLREDVASAPRPASYLQLGRALMELGDAPSAREAFTRAAELAPGSPAPLVGLAMTDGIEGDAGLARAAARMEALARRFPADQLVAFNRGWLAVYRRDAATVVASWRRAVELGPRTALGETAAELLKQVRQAGG